MAKAVPGPLQAPACTTFTCFRFLDLLLDEIPDKVAQDAIQESGCWTCSPPYQKLKFRSCNGLMMSVPVPVCSA